MSGPHRSDTAELDVPLLTRRAVADSSLTAADADLLDGYLPMLAAVAGTRRRLDRHELQDLRALGVAAAERGVSLVGVVDLYLSATWLSWRHLPRAPRADHDSRVTAVLRAANDAIVALAAGYQSAQHSAIRQEEAMRREFVDDLLHGAGDPARLPERAARFGLQLAGNHTVIAVRCNRPVVETGADGQHVEHSLRACFDSAHVLVTTKEGLLICVAPGAYQGGSAELARFIEAVREVDRECRVGVGRAYPGPHGVARSYREARDVLDFAGRLDLDASVLQAADLLVFQVLFRDRAAITDLVATVLAPLQTSRGGAAPLIATMAAYFGSGSAVAAARRLHLGVRTVTYRLARVRQLTGFDPTDPTHRLTLEAAVLGARLLDWPAEPLPASG